MHLRIRKIGRTFSCKLKDPLGMHKLFLLLITYRLLAKATVRRYKNIKFYPNCQTISVKI